MLITIPHTQVKTMFASLIERIKSYPNATLEELCESSSPQARFEFFADVDGVAQAFFSVDGYRVGTFITVPKTVPDAAEVAQKILDDTVKGIKEYVDNLGFKPTIMLIEGGKTRTHVVN